MSRIIITTDDQNLSFTNMPDIYSGDVNYDEVEFIFDNTWNSMARTAVFFTRETKETPKGILMDSSNVVKIPPELIIDKCTLYIGVYGVSDGKTIKTSQIIKYDIREGIPINTQEVEEVEEKFWEQVLSILGGVQQDISTNTSNINNINNSINSINGKISTINTNISSLQTEVSNIRTKVEKIEIATISEINTYLGI